MTDTRETVVLSREVIVARAVAVADRHGLDAVSMRRIGAELGYSGMSLYGHVANKDELLGLMVDHVLGTVPEIEPGTGWQNAVVDYFAGMWTVLREHPAIARLSGDRPIQGPRTRAHASRVLAVLRDGGLSGPLAVDALVALSCYTIGAALYSAGRAGPAASGWVDFGGPELDELHPHLKTRTDPARFRGGLDHLVRGYAADIPLS